MMALLAVLTLSAARSDGRPGLFDFYLLSLSWSPTYCEGQRDRANRLQCDSARPKAFIVHGLWPQYDRGYPEYCRTDLPDFVPRSLTDTVLDIMPSPGLVGGQWRKSDDGKFRLVIVDNQTYPDIPLTGDMEAIG